MLQFRQNTKWFKISFAWGLVFLVVCGVTNLALQSNYAEVGIEDSSSTPAASVGVPVPEATSTHLPTQKIVETNAPRLASPSPVPSQSETPKPKPTQTFPADIPKRVIDRLLEFPRIQEQADLSNIVVIDGEFCVAGELKVICYNETEDTFSIWDDFDPAPYFG